MKCAICGGAVKQATTTVTVDNADGLVVVRRVPARVCAQCGEDWLTDKAAEKVEKIVARAKRDNPQVEIVALASD